MIQTDMPLVTDSMETKVYAVRSYVSSSARKKTKRNLAHIYQFVILLEGRRVVVDTKVISLQYTFIGYCNM